MVCNTKLNNNNKKNSNYFFANAKCNAINSSLTKSATKAKNKKHLPKNKFVF